MVRSEESGQRLQFGSMPRMSSSREDRTHEETEPVSTVSVLVVDDQDLVRLGIRLLLSSSAGLSVAGEAATGLEALARARELRPDVILMDIRMPDMDGLEATKSITEQGIPSKILLFTTFGSDDIALEGLHLGASGYIAKDCSGTELVEAVRTIASGDALVPPRIATKLLEIYRGDIQRRESARMIQETLSPREGQVLDALASGYSNAEISRILFLSESTVKTHISNILVKLNVRDRVQAVILLLSSRS